MATRIVAPGGAPTHPQSAGQAPRAFYTLDQALKALGYVTMKADTLRILLEYLAEDIEDEQQQAQIRAASALAEVIAAAADTACGNNLRSSFEGWLYGEEFGKVGAA